jgi:hypothetical protein
VTLRHVWFVSASIALAGCVELPHVGDRHPPAANVAELAQLASKRVEGVTTFYERGAGARFNGLPARTDIYVDIEQGFRLQIKNPLTETGVATVIVNEEEGRFMVADFRKNKALTGDTGAVLGEYLPDLGLGTEDLAPIRLFFPAFALRAGEEAAMVERDGRYTAEIWSPRTGPRLQVQVDAWSLTPVGARLYRQGAALVEFAWSDLTWHAEQKMVVPHTVTISIPGRGKTVRLLVRNPTINKPLPTAVFGLQVPPGLEEEEVDARRAPKESAP